jgi:hypothetical protein
VIRQQFDEPLERLQTVIEVPIESGAVAVLEHVRKVFVQIPEA